MLNIMKRVSRSRVISWVALGLLLVTTVGLSIWGAVSEAAAAPIEPLSTLDNSVLPPAQEGEGEDDLAYEYPAVNPVEAAEDRRVLFEEMTLVHLLWEEYGYAKTACAGNGLNNIEPKAEGPMVLIPNAGDLSVDGSNVAIKLKPDGEITFIPRVQGQMIGLVTNVTEGGVEITEVPRLSLAEAEALLAEGRLVWTAQDQGPNGNGHGLPGHIAACDPHFSDDAFDTYQEEITGES